MRSCLNIIQALSRAAQDSTTTTRYHHSKSLDISNILQPVQQFPYPIVFMTMTGTLAKLLADHPALPLQGAQGISAELNYVLASNQIEYDTSARTSRSKSNNKGRRKAQVRVNRKVRTPTKKATGTTTKNGIYNLHNNKPTTQTEPLTKQNMAGIGMTTATLQAHQVCHLHLLHSPTESKPIHKQLPPLPTGMFTTPDTNPPQHPQPLTVTYAFNAVALKDPTMIAQIVILTHYHKDSPARSHKRHLHLGALESTHTMTHVRPNLAMENVNFANTVRTLLSWRRTSIRPSCQALLIGALHCSLTTSFTLLTSTRTRTSSTTSTLPRPNFCFKATTLCYWINSMQMTGLTMRLLSH